jgi:hypothetical protein
MRRTLIVFVILAIASSLALAKEAPRQDISRDAVREITGRCCYGEGECSLTTQAYCEGQLAGRWSQTRTCAEPCDLVVITGRCCYITPTANLQQCATNTREACAGLQGTWTQGLNCVDNSCCTNFPYTHVDLGSLTPCYPTLANNPGHAMTGIAWLGDVVSPNAVPAALMIERNEVCQNMVDDNGNREIDDDGFMPVGRNWMPCTTVHAWVKVTGGPNYPAYRACGGQLFLNGWKDGDYDGDFCGGDMCAPEWIVQDMVVDTGMHYLTFTDPGRFDLGNYPGIFRWRLTHRAVGEFGFGAMNENTCPNLTCGTFAFDSVLGEVEDYWYCDMQLAVELASFTATPGAGNVTLDWSTASESENDHFEIERDHQLVKRVSTQGNGASGHNYSWTDANVESGVTYLYDLISVDVNGNRASLRTVETTPRFDASGAISEYALYENYPNPFNPSTSIAFDLPEKGYVTLKVYNMVGQEVAELVNANLTEGRHVVNFDGRNLPSALYLYKLTAGSFSATQKMLLIK